MEIKESHQKYLWDKILEKLDVLSSNRPYARSMGYTRKERGRLWMVCYASQQQSDGTSTCWFVEGFLQPAAHGAPERLILESQESVSSHPDFWEEKVAGYDERSVIIDSYHYRLPSRLMVTPTTPGLGYAGRVFTIRFHDGREVTTNNLWSQGIIPPAYRDRLADNAVFVQEV